MAITAEDEVKISAAKMTAEEKLTALRSKMEESGVDGKRNILYPCLHELIMNPYPPVSLAESLFLLEKILTHYSIFLDFLSHSLSGTIG